jgi:hypothetical protein
MRNSTAQGVAIVDGAIYKEVVIIGTYRPQNAGFSPVKIPRI